MRARPDDDLPPDFRQHRDEIRVLLSAPGRESFLLGIAQSLRALDFHAARGAVSRYSSPVPRYSSLATKTRKDFLDFPGIS